MTSLTKHTLFKPTRSETRQSATDTVVRKMLDTEAAARNAKTERLRKLRLEKDASAPPQDAGPRRRKAAKARTKRRA